MRKRLLRSRSGFEKPESREEAIMQNILGASNVLEPSESNIEEILKSILYNTPYTKEAEFEIEKILLAIKNNGTYDGEGESRDTKILIAILNDLNYTEEAESRIEELFIEWLHQRSSIKVLEGVPPLTFVAKGNPLINYEISGNTTQSGTPTPDNPIMPQGTGERTGNLFDYQTMAVSVSGYYLKESGEEQALSGWRISDYIPCNGIEFTINKIGGNSPAICLYDENKQFLTGKSYQTGGTANKIPVTISSATNAKYIRFSYVTLSDDLSEIIITEGTTAPSEHIPYGYKIPISSANTTTPVYLGEVETTRKIGKIDLGKLNWSKTQSGNFWANTAIEDMKAITNIQQNNALCDMFNEVLPERVASTPYSFSSCLNGQKRPFVNSTGFESMTTAEFKEAMSGVYMYYVLATEETAVVNEPLRKIGDYADTLSMEQAGVEIPTVNGSNTLDVDTTLKPSNVYIEYK